jgi:drug/metabolite transporter (DMT)-like permease
MFTQLKYTGELAAIFTVIFWTITAIAFERASLKIGSIALNIIRLVLGFIFLSIYTLIANNQLFPADFEISSWMWLLLSGLIGFVFGDLFLFKSYSIIGSRFSMLIMTMVPPITAFTGWIILGETLSYMSIIGMTLTVTGIFFAIFSRNADDGKLKLKLSPKGIVFAFFGAIGQAIGLVISKLGMNESDPFAATQIRLIAGIFGFGILVTILGRWGKVVNALNSKKGMLSTTLGSFFGPFLGVSFSLLAIKYTQTGIASTIMSIVPIFIIPPAIIIYKQKVTFLEILGACISISGVSLFFL